MGIGEIISTASKTLFSRFGKTILAYLANGLVTFALAFVCGLLAVIPVIGVIALIAMYAILVPLQYGFIKQMICLNNGEDVKSFDFVQFGIDDFGMSWKVAFSLLVKFLGVIILMIVSTLLMDKVSFLSTIVMIATYIWVIVLSLKYAFVYNELAHDSNRTAKEILDTVAENMVGNKGKLILLEIVLVVLTFILSALAGIPMLGVVIMIAMIIVFMPILQYAIIIFYEDVRNTKMPNVGVVENVDVNSNNEPQEPIQNA